MEKLFLVDAPVLENKPVSQNSKSHKKIVFADKNIARAFSPGRFVTIDCGRYLRRPFSIAGVYGEKIEIIYKIAGRGTKRLAGKKKGHKINVLGPLGRGFSVPPANNAAVAITGGTGIAPIMALSQAMKKPGVLFYGVRTKSELADVTCFIKRGWQVFIATMDGSAGVRGTSVDLFMENRDRPLFPILPVVYAAGPRPMLKEISDICVKKGIKGQVSVEEMIACGVGACRGCVVKVKNGKGGYENRTVCKDGPVFNIGEIIW